MSPSVLAPAPPGAVAQSWPEGLQTPSLVSPTLLMSASGLVEAPSQRTPLPSARPDSQPVYCTCEVKLRAGMQNTGTMKPPGGMMIECLQLGKASAAATSRVAFTPSGNGKALSVATWRIPSLVHDPPGQSLSSRQ